MEYTPLYAHSAASSPLNGRVHLSSSTADNRRHFTWSALVPSPAGFRRVNAPVYFLFRVGSSDILAQSCCFGDSVLIIIHYITIITRGIIEYNHFFFNFPFPTELTHQSHIILGKQSRIEILHYWTTGHLCHFWTWSNIT